MVAAGEAMDEGQRFSRPSDMGPFVSNSTNDRERSQLRGRDWLFQAKNVSLANRPCYGTEADSGGRAGVGRPPVSDSGHTGHQVTPLAAFGSAPLPPSSLPVSCPPARCNP